MSSEEPRTPEEWRAHLQNFGAAALFARTLEMNTGASVRALLEDGYTADEVEAVFTLVALRFRALAVHPPTSGWFDLRALADAAANSDGRG